MRTFIILGIFIVNIHTLSAQKLVPTDFSFRSMVVDSTDSTYNNMRSNVITEIIFPEDSVVWLGTGLGVSVIRIRPDTITVETLPDTTGLINSPENSQGTPTNRLPQDGISAMAFRDQGRVMMLIAFAGSENDIPVGKGIAYTTNATENNIDWLYDNQPVDNESYVEYKFAFGKMAILPVTVPQANVTYDAAFSDKFVWIASWAGGLRRLRLLGDNGLPDTDPLRNFFWDPVPLPMDDQFELNTCVDAIIYPDSTWIEVENLEDLTTYWLLRDYYLNPRDPIDGGNHNHKAFSVLTYGDTIWVGTANGINRGIFGSGDCINWQHYSYPTHGLSGNFVVGLAMQERQDGKRIIWAATVNADDPTEQRGVSYTADDGLSWNTALLGERVYNITAHDSLVFAATANGLWKTEDGINWATYKPAQQAIPVPNTAIYITDEVLVNEVYSVAFDTGDTSIWIGTGDGVAYSNDLDGLNWKIFRAEYDINEDYAYPNPFSPYTHNVIGGDGYVRFHTNEWSGTFVIDLDVYNFAMEKVFAGSFDRRISSSGALKWNGRDMQGRPVDNGVYFVKLTYPENQSSKPYPHWVKLIVVK